MARLYALAASILALFLAWIGIDAAPWQTEQPPAAAAAPADPAAAALAAYERRLRRDARLVRRVLAQRERQQSIPAPPAVRIVTAAPAATTRSS
ncbi:MAG TPA: hypothetical protein VD769_00340 [Gaiellaceae bacterium]|nr:hypothetical protein [Gaiellaceae bacterium]